MVQIGRTPSSKEELTSLFSGTSLKDFYTVPELLEEFTKPCGRFKSPLSFVDRLELQIAKMVSKFRVFKSMAAISGHTIAPNWQVLLNYLHTEGILVEPRFSVYARRNDYPKFYEATLSSAMGPKDTDSKAQTQGMKGYGSSLHLEEAYSKAVGELLERHFFTRYKKSSFVKSTHSSIVKKGGAVLNLNNLPGFLPWQKERFPHLIRTENSLFHWIRVKELISEKNAWVPAQLFFWGYKFDTVPKEPVLRQSTTNGEAGNFTYVDSILSAIHETIERDAFLIFWLNTISPPILDLTSIMDAEIKELLSNLERYGLKLYVLDTTTDIEIPSCISVILDERGEEPYIALGGSAGFNIKHTILASVKEALGTGRSGFDFKFTLSEPYIPFSREDIGRDERIPLWHGKEMLERFNFFISGIRIPIHESRFGKLSKLFEGSSQEYKHVLDLLKQKGEGYEVYCHEVRHPVLKNLGYYLTRVVIPQMIPLHLNEHLPTLDSKRLREVPEKLGYTVTSLNPWPHPFP